MHTSCMSTMHDAPLRLVIVNLNRMGKKGKERKRNQQLREREHAAAVSVRILDDPSNTVETSSADTSGNGAGGGSAGSATVLDVLDVTPDELVSDLY